ncbi:hypothetical protein AVXHC19_32790 [Acidovorax sacchari]
MSPRRASHFLSLRRKKVTKERATLLDASPFTRRANGATWGARGWGVPWNSLRALRALRSDNHGKSVHEAGVSFGTSATPPPARPRRIQKGVTRAFALLGPTDHRCARPRPPPLCPEKHVARCNALAHPRPSEAMARVLHPALVAAPRSAGGKARRRAEGHACFVI